MLLLVSNVLAISFNEPTSFTQGNIKYVFHEGIEFETFNFINNGIVINDNHKLVTTPQGGTLEINFYEWSENDNLIGIKSNVPQIVNFKITTNLSKNYLFNGQEYFLDTVNVKLEETNFTYILFNEDKVVEQYEIIYKDNWAKNNIFVFVIPEVEGFYEMKIIRVTNLSFILTILTLIIISFIIRKIFKRSNKHGFHR